jgi:ParB family transcriptional regulator, chromosome partitioning protein
MTAIDTYLEESLPISSIKQPRNSVREYEKSSMDNAIRELATSIHEQGLLHPIIVRPIHNGFELVAGTRRYFAAKLLHWKYIPAKVRDLSEREAFEIQLIENIQRKTFDPIEEAKAFKRYTTEFGWGGESELARKISRSEQYVSSRIQLLRLPTEIKEEISNNKLKTSQALEILNLDEKDQRIVKDAIVKENLTVRDVRDITKPLKTDNIKRAKRNIEKSYDTYPTGFEYVHDTARQQQTKILQKAQLCLKISLYRIDNLIHDAENKLREREHDEINSILMDHRLRIHNMIDENIKEIATLNKRSQSIQP